MPVTPFQRAVLHVLSGIRVPASHFAGSLPLHIEADSPRYSHDFDLFHDAEAELVKASLNDEHALLAAGFEVERLGTWTETFRKARVSRAGESVEIDWAFDSAVRFFPVLPDADLGWRLHPFDLATNKALALAARSETRDLVDIVEWSQRYPLPAILWAACGKDPGYNPLMLLVMMRRFARVQPERLKEIIARHIDPVALKSAWIELAVNAEEEITRLADAQPELEIGVIFTDSAHEPRWPANLDLSPAEQGLTLHPPTLGGCWPHVRPLG